ncbi:hypothetical protein GLOTRDRAFT_134253 [Gloeophyllum trabeum ATCC 11539]|uniref:Uncharacterized protein n=1 Tax=Gloeophyllum trabeum (strain ATCC 11539 / FP-39264 / Madison 617) TaxID=670483 RepID=S7PQL5_GLOTA|nr:uncharacterized protein GLOTRDRAFT_134253 [Gloeophyllum trabeum ATCC 11539]EPQ50101.1 hypothetical protein GLOTRDRAFT_134253 [Gloeophyllum trabeum ATCC 11539]
MESEEDYELRLRQHIRNLLLDYALTHLTTNYVTFTQDAVSELLSGYLVPIPEVEPNTLVLPAEPFAVLSKRLQLNELPLYEEKWNLAGVEVASHIRDTLTRKTKPPSVACWIVEDEYDYMTSMYRPMSPILTRRAMHETPKPGHLTDQSNLPQSSADIISKCSIRPVEEQVLDEPSINVEEVLRLKPALNAEMCDGIRALIQTIPSLSAPRASEKDKVSSRANDFLRAHSPPPILRLEEEFVPLFPRASHPKAGPRAKNAERQTPSVLKSVAELPIMIPPAEIKEEPEEELFKQHMRVVDGWNTYAPTPCSSLGTPSLDDNTSEVDELFMPSPEKAMPIQALLSARMDEVEIPRSRKRGGARAKPRGIGAGTSLHSFLAPMLNMPEAITNAEPRIVTTPKSQPSSPRTTITASMLGQAPVSDSFEDISTEHRQLLQDSDDTAGDDFDQVVRKLYRDVKGLEPDDLIMKVKLDERECHLMDVPRLASPTVHDPSRWIPTSFESLLALQVKKGQPESKDEDEKGDLAFLSKVKGLKSLNLELSWRPFKFGPRVPTHEEVIGIAENAGDGALTEQERVNGETAAIAARINDVLEAEGTATARDHRSWRSMTEGSPTMDLATDDARSPFNPILTRKDRRNASKLMRGEELQTLQGQGVHTDDDGLDLTDEEHEVEQVLRSAKRPRLHSPNRKSFDGYDTRDLDMFSGDHICTDDSGVGLMDTRHLDRLGPNTSQLKAGDPRGLADRDQDACQSLSQGVARNNRVLMDDYLDDLALAAPLHGDDFGLQLPTLKWTNSLSAPDGPVQPEMAPDTPLGLPLSPSDSFAAQHQQPAFSITASDLASSTTLHGTIDKIIPEKPHFESDEVLSARQRLAEFIRLRSKRVPVAEVEQQESSPKHAVEPRIAPDAPVPPPQVPHELLDRTTLTAPRDWATDASVHRYMASLELIQKRGLIRYLQSEVSNVDVVERDSLGEADMILDPDTCIVFVSLPSLPAQCEATTKRLSALSWRYRDILVLFEAFPASRAYGSAHRGAVAPLELNVFSAPVVKAIKKLRRDLGIAEVYEQKRAGVQIHSAFALSVKEAAVFVRVFGNMAEAADTTGGMIWGDRAWLDVEAEGESDLAAHDGMNAFCAALILSQVTLDDFLEADPGQRMQFGPLVGQDRIMQFNEDLALRLRAMAEAIPSDPPTDIGPTTSELLYASGSDVF